MCACRTSGPETRHATRVPPSRPSLLVAMAAACAHQLVLTSRSADGRTWAVRASWTAPAPSADQEVGGGDGPMGAPLQTPRAYMSLVYCFMPLVQVLARRLIDMLMLVYQIFARRPSSCSLFVYGVSM